MPVMRLLLAARLSRVAAGQTGIESQDRLAREWAERNGHQITATAADKRSGTVQPWHRPNLRPWVYCGCDWCQDHDPRKNRIYEPARIGEFDAVVAYRLDRLSRGDNQSTNEIEAWAHRHGKMLLTEDGLVFPCEGADGIRWDLAKRLAHEEWLKTSERYRRMQAHLRENKYLVGDASFGYRIACAEQCGKTGKECGHHKTLEPNPELIPVVKDMAERYLNGDSFRSICRWLDSEGIKPRAAAMWQPTAVRDILENPALMGRRKDSKDRTELRFEGILDPATFARLQAKLAENPRHGAISDEPALLTGIIYCANCQGIMHQKRCYTARKDGSKRYHEYYRCDGSPREPSTCKNMIRMDEADARVTGLITDAFGGLEIIERVTVPGSNHDDEIADVEADIRDLDLDAADYDSQLSALRAERKRLKELPAEPAKVMERRTGVRLRDHWASLETTQARRAWLLAGKIRAEALSELRNRKTGQAVRKGRFAIEGQSGAQWVVDGLSLSHP
jgi:DNA invertase Pin-like site-specific DNA recombinase